MPKNRAFWFSLAVLTAYLLVGYLAAPRLVQPKLEQYVASQLGRELRFERLRVNPLIWSVRLDTVDLVADAQSSWPGLAFSADRVDLRFSFWRLAPVVSRLTLLQPRLVLDNPNQQLQAERYPFVGLWQQWQENLAARVQSQALPIKSWRIESGDVLVSNAGPAAEVLLDNFSLQAAPQDSDGLREFSLALSAAGNVDIEANGLFRSEDLSATGGYQLTMAPAADGSIAELQVAGAFSGEFLAAEARIDLSESRLHSSRLSTCMLDGLLCAAVMPLEAGFDSRLLVASDGVRVLEANARLSAFQLDASLGQGRVALADFQDFDDARIEWELPLAGAAASAEPGTSRDFALLLNEADNDQYQIEGQLDLVSQAVDARFQVNGRQVMYGSTQLQSIGPQADQAAHSRLDLQLENPAASLAQVFIEQHFTPALASRTLQFQLAARLDEFGLSLQENLVLAQTGLVVSSGLDTGSASAPEASGTLDAEWLLVLLQNPEEVIAFEIPELTVDAATDSSLGALVRQQALAVLTELAEQPFAGLARAFNASTQDLSEIRFAAGSAALDRNSTEALTDLAGILLQRPGLSVGVAGVHDPVLDNEALQTEQVRTHIALAAAAGLAFRTGAEPPDFTDPVVHSVIDEFARRRLPAAVRQEFAAQYGHADADQGVLPEGDVTGYYSALFELLADHAEIPQGALTTLARYRAQAVVDALEDAGVLRERLEITAQTTSNEAGAEGIPLRLQLKISRDAAAAGAVPGGADAGNRE